MKRIVAVLIALASAMTAAAQGDSLLVVYWNAENFFDWKDSGQGVSDLSFSSSGDRHWTRKRFTVKCNAIAKTLMMIADDRGRLPDAVGFEELENAFVLKRLVNSTLLRKAGYGIIHFESPDKRGIDCGIIYLQSSLTLLDASPKHLYDSSGAVMATRDILLAEFRHGGDSLAMLVNHHPSKLGSGADDRRVTAMRRMEAVCDSLEAAGIRHIVSGGDFNDTLWGDTAEGTIKFNGRWEKIDGCFVRGVDVEERVWSSPLLCTPDKQFGGIKPMRTYSGPRWLGGVSDHFPIVLDIHY